MVTGLTIACAVASVLALLLLILYVKARTDRGHLTTALARYDRITDIEKYAAEQRLEAEAAQGRIAQAQAALDEISATIKANAEKIASQDALLAKQKTQLIQTAKMLGGYKNLEDLNKQIEKQKQQVHQYNQVLGNFKSAEQLKAHIAQQTQRVAQLNQTLGKFETVAKLEGHIAQLKSKVAGLETRIRDLNDVLAGASTAGELQARIVYQQNLLAELQAETQKVEEALVMQEFGFYRPRYAFDSSSRYQAMLENIRAQQTQMVKNETAVFWEKQWLVEGSDAKGRKMMSEQTKLMLRAFNGECDAAVSKVKYNNANNLENRIQRSFEQINKLGKTNAASITNAFLQLKLQELYLVHEHAIKKQEEKEEQQRIREQMREEEKVQREAEKAQQEAEKEEAAAQRALEKARLAFERAVQDQVSATAETKAQNEALAAQVAKLENELKAAIDRKAKAIARAQLTKSGHVYILSNIGSFGEDMYKIGLTRRLEPLDRVKELGDASVPFAFDVHAMIYSENAPELEAKLHRHFADRRVNLINLRREYFHVTLEEIIEAVSQYHGDITFVKTPEAAEYRQTLAKRRDEGLTYPGLRPHSNIALSPTPAGNNHNPHFHAAPRARPSLPK